MACQMPGRPNGGAGRRSQAAIAAIRAGSECVRGPIDKATAPSGAGPAEPAGQSAPPAPRQFPRGVAGCPRRWGRRRRRSGSGAGEGIPLPAIPTHILACRPDRLLPGTCRGEMANGTAMCPGSDIVAQAGQHLRNSRQWHLRDQRDRRPPARHVTHRQRFRTRHGQAENSARLICS